MKVLVIPDIHLKYWMFEEAAKIMDRGDVDLAVCLMDIPDAWNVQNDRQLYMDTFDAAIEFHKKFPGTLWCWGNHEAGYLWERQLEEDGRGTHSGFSVMCAGTVRQKLDELSAHIPGGQLAFIHRIDNVLFLHGGLPEYFISKYFSAEERDDTDEVISRINSFGVNEMWLDPSMVEFSPLWHRPCFYPDDKMYRADDMLQVVGHTPVKEITRTRNTITCDVFSTYRNGVPIGTQEFLLLDTVTWEYRGIKV